MTSRYKTLAIVYAVFGTAFSSACGLEADESACGAGAVTSADLVAIKPSLPAEAEEVRQQRQPCSDGEFGASDAMLFLDYATDLSPEQASAAFAGSATASGWKRVPADETNLLFRRVTNDGTFMLNARVGAAEQLKASEASNAAIFKSGRATAILAWIQVDPASLGPTIDVANLLGKTPAPGISR